MKIGIGGIIHNKEWVLPYYIDALKKVKNCDIMLFVVNNCRDNTINFLRKSIKSSGLEGEVYIDNSKVSIANRSSGSKRYEALAYYRNVFLNLAFKKYNCDKLFSVDSDIIVYPNSVNDLVSFNKDIISLLVWNDLHCSRPFIPHIGNVMELKRGGFRHIRVKKFNTLIEVDLTGAVYMIDKKVYEKGVRYKNTSTGEDAGFCIHAKEKGFKLWCYTKLCSHLMTKKIAKQYRNNLKKKGV